jgi:glutamate synthase (ferredoxin)
LFVFDPKNEVYAKLHSKSVAAIETTYPDYEWIHPLIERYYQRTKSRQAGHILKNWSDIRRERRLKKILPLAVARALQDFKTVGTNAG